MLNQTRIGCLAGLQLIVLVVLCAELAIAKPFYFFSSPPKPEVPAQPVGGEQVAGTDGQLPQRLQSHLGQLYNHGSSAVKTVAEKVQPDISNIGQDLTDVYKATRENVGRRIEPYAQTMRPYIDRGIDHAHKVITPIVNQAREEVPKLVSQAKEEMPKLVNQVREGITGVWDKIKPADQAGNGAKAPEAGEAQIIGDDRTAKIVENAIQQPAEPAKAATAA